LVRISETEVRRLDPPARARVFNAFDRLAAGDRSLDVRRRTANKRFRLRDF